MFSKYWNSYVAFHQPKNVYPFTAVGVGKVGMRVPPTTRINLGFRIVILVGSANAPVPLALNVTT